MRDLGHVLAIGEIAEDFYLPAVERVERIPDQALIGEGKLERQIAGEIAFSGADGSDRLDEGLGVLALRQIASRATFDRARHEDRIVIHRENDDLCVGVALQQKTQQLEAGDPRKVDVENDYIRRERGVFFEGLVGVVSFGHFDVLLPREHASAALDHHRMVVDDKNAHEDFLVVDLDPCCEKRGRCQ